MTDKIFPSGLRVEPPRNGAPDFVKGRVSVHLADFVEWAKGHVNERGWLNFDLKERKSGTLYVDLNTFKPRSTLKDAVEDDMPAF